MSRIGQIPIGSDELLEADAVSDVITVGYVFPWSLLAFPGWLRQPGKANLLLSLGDRQVGRRRRHRTMPPEVAELKLAALRLGRSLALPIIWSRARSGN
jgi:hypothetical protein